MLFDLMARLRIILAQDGDRRFTPFDRVGHIESRRGTPLDDLLAEFRALRARNLAKPSDRGGRTSQLSAENAT